MKIRYISHQGKAILNKVNLVNEINQHKISFKAKSDCK